MILRATSNTIACSEGIRVGGDSILRHSPSYFELETEWDEDDVCSLWLFFALFWLLPLLTFSSFFLFFFHHVLIRLPFFFCKTPQLCLRELGSNSSTSAITRFSKGFQFQLWLATWLVFLHSKLRTWKLAHSPFPPPLSFLTWPPPLWVRAVDRIPSISRGSENIKMQFY